MKKKTNKQMIEDLTQEVRELKMMIGTLRPVIPMQPTPQPRNPYIEHWGPNTLPPAPMRTWQNPIICTTEVK